VKLKSSRGAVIRNYTVNNSSVKELSLILAIFGRFLLHRNVADVYNISHALKILLALIFLIATNSLTR